MAIKKPGSQEPQSEYSPGARISKRIKERLDYQIKIEADAAQIYRGMAQWCDFNGYQDASKFMNRHAEEEMSHMRKVQKYSQDRNCLPSTPAMIKPSTEYTDLVDVISAGYKHEKTVTNSYQEFAKIACAEGDYVTFAWMQYFLKEQIEEERVFNDILSRIEMMKKEGVGMLAIEEVISGNREVKECSIC